MLSLSALRNPVSEITQANMAETRATTSLREAAQEMARDGIGALLVRRGTHVVGIVTERDIVVAVGEGLDVDETRIMDIMTENLAGVAADSTIGTALDRMATHAVRHLVVRDGAQIIGVISVRDILSVLHAEVQQQSG